MSKKNRDVFIKIFKEEATLDMVVKEAVRQALEEHRKRRQFVAGWNGKGVVIVQPEDIPGDLPLPPQTQKKSDREEK